MYQYSNLAGYFIQVRVSVELRHITAIGETAPGREWLIENSATELIKSLDEQSKTPVVAHGPLARFADSNAKRVSVPKTAAKRRKSN